MVEDCGRDEVGVDIDWKGGRVVVVVLGVVERHVEVNCRHVVVDGVVGLDVG